MITNKKKMNSLKITLPQKSISPFITGKEMDMLSTEGDRYDSSKENTGKTNKTQLILDICRNYKHLWASVSKQGF